MKHCLIKKSYFLSILCVSLLSIDAFGDADDILNGRNFKIPATQYIHFISLEKIDPALFNDPSLPRKVDLRSVQSKVKFQGQRGACTYFVMTSLLESLIKKATNVEVDLSEEYLAWAAKNKKNLRSLEEDSSVAVNAITIQDSGFMYEADLPYQQSWFNKGFPCEGQKGQAAIDPICFSHKGPSEQNQDKINSGELFEFKDIGSSSIEVVRELAKSKTPITVSILAHPRIWVGAEKTGNLVLDKVSKKECQLNPKNCSGHAALIVGYNIEKRLVTFKNSWGEHWGQQGYGTIPFDYLDQMSHRRFLTAKLLKPFRLPK